MDDDQPYSVSHHWWSRRRISRILYKLHTQPGRWRVNIETERGQLIGRLKFEIIRVPTDPSLETKTL